MEFRQACATKNNIENYWSRQAPEYDRHFGHGIGSTVEKKLWLDLLDKNVCKGKKLTVLDVGCGTVFLSLLLAELGCEVTGIDFSTAMRAEAQRKADALGIPLKLLSRDAEAPNLPDESFDVVISRHLVWTLTNPSEALFNWKRLLKIGGRVVIIDGVWTPRDFAGRVRYFFVDLIRRIKGTPHHS